MEGVGVSSEELCVSGGAGEAGGGGVGEGGRGEGSGV